MNLVLDELITNGVDAFSDIAGSKLRLCLLIDDGAVIPQFEDNVGMFNPFEEVPEPDLTLGFEERPIGGLGLFLVEQLADGSAYERIGGRNHITLRHVTGGES